MDKKIRAAVFQTIASVLILIVIVAVAAYFYRQNLKEFSVTVVNAIGILGIAAGIFLADSLPAFIPIDFFLVLAIAAGLQDAHVILVCFFASILGGSFSYASGKYIFPAIPFVNRLLLTYEERVSEWVRLYGKHAVVISALTPLPYSWMAYTAGSFRMRYDDFFYASLFRLARFGIYYYAIKLGWMNYGTF